VKDYEVSMNVTGVVVYRVRANSPQDAMDLVMRGEHDDMDFSDWVEDADSLEVVELE